MCGCRKRECQNVKESLKIISSSAVKTQQAQSRKKSELIKFQIPSEFEPDSSFQGQPHFTSLPATFPIVAIVAPYPIVPPRPWTQQKLPFRDFAR
jgi:hypothetical protein